MGDHTNCRCDRRHCPTDRDYRPARHPGFFVVLPVGVGVELGPLRALRGHFPYAFGVVVLSTGQDIVKFQEDVPLLGLFRDFPLLYSSRRKK